MGLNDHHTLRYRSFGEGERLRQAQINDQSGLCHGLNFMLDTWSLHGVL